MVDHTPTFSRGKAQPTRFCRRDPVCSALGNGGLSLNYISDNRNDNDNCMIHKSRLATVLAVDDY